MTTERFGILRDLLRGRAGQATVIGILALLSTAATLALPWSVGRLIATLGTGQTDRWTVALIALGLGSALANAAATFLLARLGQQMIYRLRLRTIRHALGMPIAEIRREGAGNLVSRITADTGRVKKVVDVGPIQLPIAGLTAVGTLVIMGIIDWVLLLVTLAAFLVAAVLIVAVVKGLRRSYAEVAEVTGGLAQRFVAVVEAAKIIKAYRAEEQVTADLGEQAHTVARKEIEAARMEALMTPVITLGQQIALVAVIAGGGARLLDGRLALAELIAFLLYLLQLTGPFMMISAGMTALKMGAVARDRFNALFAVPRETDRSTGPADATAPAGTPAVEFDGVEFRYGLDPVLRRASFHVPATGLTAVVGLSGAGKTTSLELIERFADPDAGTIRLFGRETTRWPLAELRRRVAYVDQSATLVQDTVRRNLTLGRDPGAFSDAELMAVLERVGLADEIRRTAQGLDTVLAGAVDLSGGQRQRLAIARAMLAGAPLVLLDEPSSHLDSINEQKLRDLVDDLAASRAVLVVAHRISTVQHADHVVVLDAGAVVAQGSHETLLRECPRYADLVRGQLLVNHEVAA
jgi:ABC-type multidrug transport system fused ATPase/permease subunit